MHHLHGTALQAMLTVLQAVGVLPNVASAEALLQSCRDCTRLSSKVNSLTAPFQTALAAAQLLPVTDTAHHMAVNHGTDITLPSTEVMYRYQSASSMMAMPGLHQSVGVGQMGAAPQAGQLSAAPWAEPPVAKPDSGLPEAGPENSVGQLPSAEPPAAAPMSELSAGAPELGPPTQAMMTPDLQSEGDDISTLHVEGASGHVL